MRSWRKELAELNKLEIGLEEEHGPDWRKKSFRRMEAFNAQVTDLARAFLLWKKFFDVLLPVLGNAADAAHQADGAVDEYRARSARFEGLSGTK